MPARPERGFTLMEAAIAIAVIAILAGTAIPFALKNINQAKEQRARTELKVLYEACFGALDRGFPGMQGDFGFPNGAANPNLAITTAATGTRGYGTYPGSPLLGGWRGPYWSGSTTNTGLPQDPWGRAYLIRQVTNGWQLYTRGANGVSEVVAGNASAQGDDLVYPNPTAPLPAGTITVNVYRLGNYPVAATSVVATTPNRANAVISTNLPLKTAPNVYQTTPAAPVAAGQVAVAVAIPAQPAVAAAGLAAQPAQTQTRLISLSPGGTQTLSFTFN